jgi:hypothetical protein
MERVFAWEVPAPAASLRASESGPLCIQDPRLHDDQPVALLLTISAGANTKAMAHRAMKRHVNVICNPDKPSLK